MLGRGGSWVNKPGPSMTSSQLLSRPGSYVGQNILVSNYNWNFTWTGTRWWPQGYPDPKYGFLLHDEFLGADRIGQLDWSANNGQVAGNALNQGQASVSISTATQTARMSMQVNSVQISTMDLYMETLIQMPAAATTAEDGVAIWGMSDVTAYDANGAGTDGAYFSVNRAVNGSSLICYTQNNTASSVIVTTANIAAGIYYRLGILISASSSVQYFINGSSLGTLTTNIPAGTGRQTGINYSVFKTNGVTNPIAWTVDYFAAYAFYNGSRG